jgi:serine/threonine-protein kinase
VSLAPGSRLGRYRLEERLGEGGMGEVYRAFDARLGRAVAVKILPEERLSRAAAARLEREARAVAQLAHPNIVVVHDFGAEEGTLYLVTELLDGESLAARLARGPLLWRAAVALGREAARGLAAAHARGIVHRDLKPSNLFVLVDGRLKILDFGIARLLEPTGTGDGDAALTQTGGVIGSPGYMSPEQAAGGAVDPRSDLFSLGAVVYEMLAGRPAFGGPTPTARLVGVLRDEPPALGALLPDLPAELSALVERCLAKEPERRPGSAAELAASFDRLLGGAGEITAPTAELAPGAVARPAAAGPRRLAVLPLAAAGSDPELPVLADGLTEGLIRSLSRRSGRSVLAASTVFRFRGAADPLAVGRELSADAVLVGRLEPRGGALTVAFELVDVARGEHLWGESYRRAPGGLADLEREVARALATRFEPDSISGARRRAGTPPAIDAEAYRDYLRGRAFWNQRTEQGLERSRDCFQRALERDPAFALAWAGLADSFNVAPFWGMAPPTVAFPRARDAAERALALDPGLPEAHAALGYLRFYFDWSFAKAENDFERALAENPSDAETRRRRGVALALVGRAEESRRELEWAERLDPLSLSVRADRGLAAWLSGDADRAVAIGRDLVAAKPGFAPAQFYLGLALTDRGRLEEAGETLGAAGDRSAAIAARGEVAARSGDLDAARRALARIAERAATRYVSLYPLACLHLAMGEREAALATLERALVARCETLVWALRDPRLAPLRGEPRLAALLAELGDLASV